MRSCDLAVLGEQLPKVGLLGCYEVWEVRRGQRFAYPAQKYSNGLKKQRQSPPTPSPFQSTLACSTQERCVS